MFIQLPEVHHPRVSENGKLIEFAAEANRVYRLHISDHGNVGGAQPRIQLRLQRRQLAFLPCGKFERSAILTMYAKARLAQSDLRRIGRFR